MSEIAPASGEGAWGRWSFRIVILIGFIYLLISILIPVGWNEGKLGPPIEGFQLKNLYLSIMMYEADHGDRLPASLDVLGDEYLLGGRGEEGGKIRQKIRELMASPDFHYYPSQGKTAPFDRFANEYKDQPLLRYTQKKGGRLWTFTVSYGGEFRYEASRP